MSAKPEESGWADVLRNAVDDFGGTDLPDWLVDLIAGEHAIRCNCALRRFANRSTALIARLPAPRDEAAVLAILDAAQAEACDEITASLMEAQELLLGSESESIH